jgi:hypothetical protein
MLSPAHAGQGTNASSRCRPDVYRWADRTTRSEGIVGWIILGLVAVVVAASS